jgi:hypothetical protein
VQDILEEKLSAMECESGNVEVLKKHTKKFVFEIMNAMFGKVNRKARKPWITEEMINRMAEQRKWKNISNEKGRKNSRRLLNELKRVLYRCRKKYLEIV